MAATQRGLPMPKRLSKAEIGRYRDQGYCSPITVLAPDDAAAFLARLDRAVAGRAEAAAVLKMKSHLVFGCLDELLHLPAILDAVEDLLGADILAWSSSIFAKGSVDPRYVSWHQDLTYWGLEPPDVVTTWVALSESSSENGCMRVVPGSHIGAVVPHRDTYGEHNLLSRGQEIAAGVDESRAVDVELLPGQMSLHHAKLFHGSAPNRSDRRRVGFSIRYIPATVRQARGDSDSATLVRGADPDNHFEHEPRPAAEFDATALTLHGAICARNAKFLFDGTG